MLYNFQRKKLCRHLLVGGALFAVGMGMFSCKDTYDLDDEQPSNLNNIYGYLRDQGNFQNTLRLINDLGQAEILSKTGSKTMFVADDDAFKKFYASNSWGVKSYEELTLAQKKLLLNSAMIDNPYSTSMLSTASGNDGPVKGEVCRRSSSLTLYDSVLYVLPKSDKPEEKEKAEKILPKNSRFDQIRDNHDTIVLYTDASNAAPMIHFNYKFVASNKLANTDIDFLYNDKEGTRKNEDVYVNEAKVIKPNIFSKNGFIHQVDRVIMPLDNMAEIIRKDPDTQQWSKIIERFAAPDYNRDLTDAYNLNRGSQLDSVYIKRYFSDRSAGSDRETDVAFSKDKDNNTFDASLKFDPGWNKYMPLSGDPRDAMMEDMAVMLVPTDKAFNDWWNGITTDKDGKVKTTKNVIRDFYETVEKTPNSVLDDLIRVNQLTSLVSSLPSRFEDVLDDANNTMGLKLSDIESVTLGCNGVIYKTNKVFAPTAYSSVLFPAIIDTTNFKIIENAISCLDYDKYLNSMVSKYIFLLPTNKGMLSYVDPVSYGQTTSTLWEFGFDESKDKFMRIYADIYKCELDATGRWQKTGDRVTRIENMSINPNASASQNVLRNRLSDLLDNIIVVEPYEDGKKYYKTKADTYVYIPSKPAPGGEVYGPLQAENQEPLNIVKVFDGEDIHNGITVVLDGPIMGARRSVSDVVLQLKEDTGDFNEFYDILTNCGALSRNNDKDKWAGSSLNLFNLKTYGDVGAEDKPTGNSKTKATYLLNNYQYTFYVPTDAAMQKAYDMGLPTLADLQDAEAWDLMYEGLSKEEQMQLVKEKGCCAGDSAARIQEAMLDFVKYHIQTESVFIDKGTNNMERETGKTSLSAASDMAENVKPEDIDYEANKVTIKGKAYDIKSLEAFNDDGTRSVVYYTGLYSPGGAYRLKLDRTSSGMTVKDNIGNTHNVIMKDGWYNIQAQEYWYTSTYDGTNSKVKTATDDPHRFYLNNSSAVTVHAIDGPLVYADGKHKDLNGDIVPTQFKYTYKKLTSQ